MSNRLKEEKSPYLIQHAENPVNWYPWTEEAFTEARDEDKPIFLSIGYATCHWCHVMAHESFEDEEVAELMNETFVNIKVDREERPDVDNTYMTICQMLTGSGGWPLTIFMTPDKKPFYAATYIPKTGRYGRPGMKELIPKIQSLWIENRDKINNSAEEITRAFQKTLSLDTSGSLEESITGEAYDQFKQRFDIQNGGFGNAPKFPSPHNLIFLLRHWYRTEKNEALSMVSGTLEKMRRGGIFDHIGFGFHRYSTDAEWLVPHFEKMLYDQAMLMMAYTEAWQVAKKPLFKETACEIADYLFRVLRDENGGFYSAEDADSEGEEGKFYVWSVEEIREVLPLSEAELFIELYNLEEEGNYRDESSGQRTGKNIPHIESTLEDLAGERGMEVPELRGKINHIRNKLLSERKNRVRPLMDDKILTDWNGLTIAALAKAGSAFNEPAFIEKASEAASFILDKMSEGSKLFHRYRKGDVDIEANADDYAFLIWGLTELYEATFETEYLEQALKINTTLISDFWDNENGGFYFTAKSGEEILGRKKEVYDGAIPSGNSVAMLNLLRLGRITGTPEFEEKAHQIGEAFAGQVRQAPTGFGQLLQAIEFTFGPTFEVVISGPGENEDTQKMLEMFQKRYMPNMVMILNSPEDQSINELAPFTQHQTMINEKTTVYLCRDYQCDKPVNNKGEMEQLLKKLSPQKNF